jgi:hypothetical protein
MVSPSALSVGFDSENSSTPSRRFPASDLHFLRGCGPAAVSHHVPVDPSESHLGIQPGTESMLLGQQVHLKDGTNDQHRCRLNHAVPDARNAERPLASVALRYPHPQEGLGDILSRTQLLPQRSSQRSRPWVSIRSNVSLSTPDAPAFARQCPKGRRSGRLVQLSFRLQRGLQLLKRFRRRS